MENETHRPDPALRQNPDLAKNSDHKSKDEKLIVVKKKDNSVKYHEEPFDEQGYNSFEEIKEDKEKDITGKG